MSDIKFIKPKDYLEVYNQISVELNEIIFEMKDRELFYDRNKFVDESTEWFEYKDDEDFHKDMVYETSIRTIATEIAQMVIFGRIIKEGLGGEYNLPKGEVPLYLRQIDEDGTERDLFNFSSGKMLKKMMKSEKGRKRIKENNI
jgi:hypothetical protein